MSEYMFGVGRGKVTAAKAKKVNAIAKKHNAWFITANIPGDGHKYWFAGPNLGHPFDKAMAEAVYADLDVAGISLP
jgi:hypothetical protein